MGELLRIIDFLERKHYAKYCWAYERIRFLPIYSVSYMFSQEDSHGYSIID